MLIIDGLINHIINHNSGYNRDQNFNFLIECIPKNTIKGLSLDLCENPLRPSFIIFNMPPKWAFKEVCKYLRYDISHAKTA